MADSFEFKQLVPSSFTAKNIYTGLNRLIIVVFVCCSFFTVSLCSASGIIEVYSSDIINSTTEVITDLPSSPAVSQNIAKRNTDLSLTSPSFLSTSTTSSLLQSSSNITLSPKSTSTSSSSLQLPSSSTVATSANTAAQLSRYEFSRSALFDDSITGLVPPTVGINASDARAWVRSAAETRYIPHGLCDYCLEEGEGNFTSNNYPLHYPNDHECTFRIKRSEGVCAVELIFHDFDVDESPECRSDFLKIDGRLICGPKWNGAREIIHFKRGEREMRFHFVTDSRRTGRGFWIEVVKRPGNCVARGPAFTDQNGVCEERHGEMQFLLWSPRYPDAYPNNEKCRFYIRRAQNSICAIRLTFLAFDVESSDGCRKDFLDIDGHRLCGHIPTGAVRTYRFTNDQMIMRFHTDSAANRRGFHIQAQQISSCDDDISLLPPPPLCDLCTEKISGDIASYSYPEPYRNNLLCRITISRPSVDFCAVRLFFEQFDVEESLACDRDFLQVESDRLCGSNIAGLKRTVTYDADGNIVLVFRTDSAVTRKGFHIRFSQIPCGQDSTDITPHRPLADESESCNVSYQQRMFYIQSPHYPSAYPNRMECTYTVHKLGRHICYLEFVYAGFDLESSPECRNDYLEIDGERHCGTLPLDHMHVIPFSSVSKSLRFHTNEAGARRGFSIRARQIDCDENPKPQRFTPSSIPPPAAHPRFCDAQFESMEIELESPKNIPESDRNNVECLYTVRRANPDICRLEVTFLEFQLKSSETCNEDYLSIDDVRICGSVVPGTVQTFDLKSNEAAKLLKFRSNMMDPNRHFHIKLRQQLCDGSTSSSTPVVGVSPTSGDDDDSDGSGAGPIDGFAASSPGPIYCDETFSKIESFIISMSFPNHYDNHLECRYVFRKVDDSVCRLELTFLNFDIESSTNCEYDYLEVDQQKLCGIFSANTTGLYDFSDETKIIRFHSDAANTRPGFRIRARQLKCDVEQGDAPQVPPSVVVKSPPPHPFRKCDKIFTSRLFDLRSLDYPTGYPENLDCKYIVFQVSSRVCRLELTFIDFDVERESGDCSSDYFEVDGERMCGHLPADTKKIIPFTTSQKVLRLHTDSVTSRPGFHIKVRQIECGERPPPIPPSGSSPPADGPTNQGGIGVEVLPPSGSGSACLYEFSDLSGVFYSSGFPGPYPNKMYCTYRLFGKPGHCSVELSFVQFRLDNTGSGLDQSETCGDDFMEIGGVRYCHRQLEGQLRIVEFEGSPPMVTMHFITDARAAAGKGFLGFYKQLPCHSGDRPVIAPSGETPSPTPTHHGERRQPSCDRLYALPEFNLDSPGYPQAYSHGLDCRFFIRRFNDAVCSLEVTFTNFDLEESPQCYYDYLEIDGERVCGKVQTGTIRMVPFRDFQTSFRFHSNQGIQGSGFLLSIRQLDCNGSPVQLQDSIGGASGVPGTAPEYPPPPRGHGHRPPHPTSVGTDRQGMTSPIGGIAPHYPPQRTPGQCDQMLTEQFFEIKSTEFRGDHIDCRFTIVQRNTDMCRLELLFVRFNVDCRFDQFRVDDVHLCGVIEHDSTRSFDFSGMQKFLYFHSTSGARASDFIIRGRQISCSSPPPPPASQGGFGQMPPQSGPPPPHQHYPPTHGGYPQPQPPSQNYPPPRTGGAVYPPRTSGYPPSVSVGGYPPSGSNGGYPPLGSSGGYPFQPPYPQPPSGRGLDGRTSVSTQTTTNSFCDAMHSSLEFLLTSASFPQTVNGPMDCRYVVERFDSATCALEVFFNRFELPDSVGCSSSYIDVDGQKLCGSIPPHSIQKFNFYQPERQKVIRFHLERGVIGAFSIRVRQVTDCAPASELKPAFAPPINPLCDYCQRETQGQLSSPDYPRTYPVNTKCTYRIQPVEGFCEVEMYFHEFDLESSPACQKDTFFIGDKLYCGTDLKKMMQKYAFPKGRGAEIKIQFVTDNYGVGRGFHLEYRQLQCVTPDVKEPPSSTPAPPIAAPQQWVRSYKERNLKASVFVAKNDTGRLDITQRVQLVPIATNRTLTPPSWIRYADAGNIDLSRNIEREGKDDSKVILGFG